MSFGLTCHGVNKNSYDNTLYILEAIMKIAITAANGKLSTEIITATIKLVSRENVIGLARSPEKAQHLGIEIRPGDYNNHEQLKESLQNVDVLLLLSGMDPPDKRIEQHRHVINAAKESGVKKIVYTSVQGPEEGTAFSPIVQSNRQTEKDIMESGLDWVIGRNGIYIEPDIEYIERYKKDGFITNCAGDGKCGYTTRNELAWAYTHMLTEEIHNGQIYNLNGLPITQYELATYLNTAFGTSLSYQPMSVDDYRKDRTAELGDFIGNAITGIYQGIREGKSNNISDFYKAAGREHQSWDHFFDQLNNNGQPKY